MKLQPMGTWNQVTRLTRPTPLDVKCIHQVGMFCIHPLFSESDVTSPTFVC